MYKTKKDNDMGLFTNIKVNLAVAVIALASFLVCCIATVSDKYDVQYYSSGALSACGIYFIIVCICNLYELRK